MSTILKVSDLHIAFDSDTLFSDVSFELEAGEALAVIGPNGAGKSVFLKALLDMVPYEGHVEWAKDTRLGYVPQKIDADRHLPINFNNLLAAKATVAHLRKEDINEIVQTVGLTQKILETPVGHLSGGQFQRALIAFALLTKPNVLLLDEPTASIDKSGEEQMYELIHRLQEEFGITIILVSHDLSFVYRYATKVLSMNHSGAVQFGKPSEALMPAALEKLYGSYKHLHEPNQ
jgi:ABC-type Mn2+/Zn2+ transport system ATPase subunit